MATLNVIEIVEEYVQRNETVQKWVKDKKWSPVEELAAWEMFRFCCEIEPRLRGKVIGYTKQVNK